MKHGIAEFILFSNINDFGAHPDHFEDAKGSQVLTIYGVGIPKKRKGMFFFEAFGQHFSVG
jgi:hypothetical protein